MVVAVSYNHISCIVVVFSKLVCARVLHTLQTNTQPIFSSLKTTERNYIYGKKKRKNINNTFRL